MNVETRAQLQKSIDHIKELVGLHQSFAKASAVIEAVAMAVSDGRDCGATFTLELPITTGVAA